MGKATIKEDWEALRNESLSLLPLGVLMKYDERPKLKRDIQLSVRNIEFLQQIITHEVIEETPLKDIQYKPEGVAQYAIEIVERDSSEIPLTDAQTRVLNEAKLIDQAKGSLEKTHEGKVEPACFAASTLVHIYSEAGRRSQVGIEHVGIGTLVLSRCDETGVQAYRPVVDLVEHEDRDIWVVTHRDVFGREETLWTTAEHPFWVSGLGWTPVSGLQPGHQLEISNAYGAGPGRPHDHVTRSMEDELLTYGRWTSTVVSAKDQRCKLTVYNIEVEGFHTYFVGERGAWVHNTKANKSKATPLEPSKPKAETLASKAKVPVVGGGPSI